MLIQVQNQSTSPRSVRTQLDAGPASELHPVQSPLLPQFQQPGLFGIPGLDGRPLGTAVEVASGIAEISNCPQVGQELHVLGAPYVIPGLVAELSDPTSDKIEVLIDGASYVSGMAASSGMVDGVSFGIAGADWLHESYRHGFGSRGAAFKILQLVAQGAVVGAGWSGHPILAALGHGAVFTLKLGEITYKLSEKRVGAMASGAASFGYNAQMQVTAPSTGQPLLPPRPNVIALPAFKSAVGFHYPLTGIPATWAGAGVMPGVGQPRGQCPQGLPLFGTTLPGAWAFQVQGMAEMARTAHAGFFAGDLACHPLSAK